MDHVHVKPSETARVRQPERGSAVMGAEGGWVPRNVYYTQLLKNGDVVESDPQPEFPKPGKGDAERTAPAAAPPAPAATERAAPARSVK